MAKLPIYIRIDKETLDWFKAQAPKGYQTRMNDVLRAFKENSDRRVHFLLGRAQEIFRQYHTRCFWHLKKDLQITVDHIPLVQAGLRKHGGREGFLLAAELELKRFPGENSAD